MDKTLYGIGEPNAETTGADWYVDLETDTMYELQDGEWVAMLQHGEPIVQGVVVKSSFYDMR